jgi:nicotinate phosphoribosyltransferase
LFAFHHPFLQDSPKKRSKSEVTKVDIIPPTNNLVGPLLTDMYQISMTYAHFKNQKHNDHAVFDLFFRKCPFKGEFAIFAGLDECLRFISTYSFSESDVKYLKELMPTAEPEFFAWLSELDCSTIKVYAIDEGSAVFPREPLLRIEGPLGITQLLETTLLNLINFPTLVCTNACRMKLAVGENKTLMEFGLRRAQGPDGAYSASKYSYMGGFDATSNVTAGKLAGIAVKGTHAHAYVMSYTSLDNLFKTTLKRKDAQDDKEEEFVQIVLEKRKEMGCNTNDGELAAFISYAQAYPDGLLALVDTYDTLLSGVPNFIAVSLALMDFGYNSIGIRLDSGDLAYLSCKTREAFVDVDKRLNLGECFSKKNIVASNDLSEDVLIALKMQGHEIDTFGIGTNLVTCLKQPALGAVFKLVEINGHPRIKLSQEIEKMVIPGRKNVYRLSNAEGVPIVDYMTNSASTSEPKVGERLMIRHPFIENKRAYFTPAKVEDILKLVWDGVNSVNSSVTSVGEQQVIPTPSLEERRSRCMKQLLTLRSDHIRFTNATPYKVSSSEELFKFTHDLWLENAPVQDL